MAAPRRVGSRIYARPHARTGRPRFYYDTDRQAFYNMPRRGVRSHRLDIRELLSDDTLRRDFRVHKDGGVYFRGQRVGWDVDRPPPARLRSREPVGAREGPGHVDDTYIQRILARNPHYRLRSTYTRRDEVTYVLQSTDRRDVFTITREL